MVATSVLSAAASTPTAVRSRPYLLEPVEDQIEPELELAHPVAR
jgi:hypothetical protein